MTNKNNNIPAAPMPGEMPPIPAMDAMTANKILNAALEENKMEPSTIPIEVLEKWGNYNRSSFRIAKKVCYLLLVITLMLPLLCFKPGIVAERVDVDKEAAASVMYQIDITGLLPVEGVSAKLDGTPIAVHQESAKSFQVEVTENGELELTAISINGQITTRKYNVNYLDNERPVYIGSEVKHGHLFITVEDDYSGIDYDNISGLTPVSVDPDNGVIEFVFPTESTIVKVPDMAGNVLEMIVSPQQ